MQWIAGTSVSIYVCAASVAVLDDHGGDDGALQPIAVEAGLQHCPRADRRAHGARELHRRFEIVGRIQHIALL